jgi:hypothetical protein
MVGGGHLRCGSRARPGQRRTTDDGWPGEQGGAAVQARACTYSNSSCHCCLFAGLGSTTTWRVVLTRPPTHDMTGLRHLTEGFPREAQLVRSVPDVTNPSFSSPVSTTQHCESWRAACHSQTLLVEVKSRKREVDVSDGVTRPGLAQRQALLWTGIALFRNVNCQTASARPWKRCRCSYVFSAASSARNKTLSSSGGSLEPSILGGSLSG